MSLDVWLEEDPCPSCEREGDIVFEANITHNLSSMANAAGIYKHCWRPEEVGVERAQDLTEPLQKGLADMKERPEFYKQFDSPNGWGTYEHFVPWVERYLEACIEFPEARVRVSR